MLPVVDAPDWPCVSPLLPCVLTLGAFSGLPWPCRLLLPAPCLALCAFLSLCEVAATGAAAGCSVEQGPTVSPCPRCAGSAFCETVIVTNGFVFEWVWWQIVTFEAGYWSAVGVESENPTTLAAIPVPANDAG